MSHGLILRDISRLCNPPCCCNCSNASLPVSAVVIPAPRLGVETEDAREGTGALRPPGREVGGSMSRWEEEQELLA